MKNTIKKYILRSIDPWSGFMKDFKLEPDEPVLIGRMSLKIVLEFPKGFLKHAPESEVEHLSDYIKSTKRLIKPEECKIRGNPISRMHCMIFPAQEAKILDLYSTNGTVLANIDGGIKLKPGRRMELQHNSIILLAKGAAIFQYFSFDDSERDDLESEEDIVADRTDFKL